MLRSAVLLLAAVVPLPLAAQDDEPKIAIATLRKGDPAPPLTIKKWIKGEPVKVDDKKGVYVVEFWATWCGPCVQTIPHLSEMAAHFKTQGVTFIGVSIDEAKTEARVEPFVKNMGAKMEYTVALDDKNKTNEAWLEAAMVEGIPHAFLVNKEGTIEWHGHPMDGLGLKIARLVGDKKYAEEAEAAAKQQEVIENAGKALNGALKDEKWDEALKLADALFALDSKQYGVLFLKYQIYTDKKKEDKESRAKVEQEILQKIDNAEVLNEIAELILTDDSFEEGRDVKFGLALAKKAHEKSEGKSWEICIRYASALSVNGKKEEAISQAKKAIELAKKEDDVGKEQLEALEETLKSFSDDTNDDAKDPAAPGEKKAAPAKKD